MKDFKTKPLQNKHLWGIYLLTVIMLIFISYVQWIIGLVFAIFVIISFYYNIRTENSIQKKQANYIKQLSYRINKAGEEALFEMPLGIILYNNEYEIEWVNPYMYQFNDDVTTIGQSLNIYSDKLIPMIEQDEKEIWFSLNNYTFKAKVVPKDRLVYLFDRTEQVELEQLYKNEKVVIAHIYLDNYEEISRNMSDNLKSQLNSKVTSVLNSWAEDYGFYLKRTSQERFIGVITQEVLQLLEKSKFEILDEIRELVVDKGQRNPITISIGIGMGNVPLPELAKLAQSSLDLALGRGGDQIAIRDETGKVRFYGGKTNPMEKRTRVRARVISHALRELVIESDNVIIMGHKAPDMDSLGSTIGVLNIAKSNGIDGYIVFDRNDVTTGVSRIMEEVKQEETLWKHFITPEEAEAVITSRSLIVIVDTHRPSLVVHEPLLYKTDYKVVIDHHRRGEDFVDNPTLVYMEPYASSTAELVTELIEYQPKKEKLSPLEATSLLAGIIVDTKSFALRTGSRTFDAASYLRSKGADPVLIQHFLKEDLTTYVQRSKLIEKSYLYKDSLAITKADEDETYNQILIAQTADILLTMDQVNASFVISKRNDGLISISARSLGDINVQLIMEQLDGGGHLTNAATQLQNMTIDEVEQSLLEVIDEYLEGRQ